jgi:Sulfotransferase family
MINHQYRCIFIHIPKTAGKSITSFFGMKWQNHKDLARYAKELDSQIFADYFKFAVVRNPWDRMLSEYNFQRKKNSLRKEKLFALDDAGHARSFREWVEAALRDPFHYEPRRWGGEVTEGIHRWSPQVDWISLNGQIAVDRVLRMENLENDFEDVRRLLGKPAEGLPCRNWKFHLHYSHYYDESTKRLVGDYYARDIEAFGYRYGSRKADIGWATLERCRTRLKSVSSNALSAWMQGKLVR